jgi:drug/metabolite transporter (DMT)-like permease
VPISEPTTLASDWLLAAVAVVLGARLFRAGGRDGRPATRPWGAAFLAGAAGLLALGLSAAALNHNDVCHVLQLASLWPFYRAGLRLRRRDRLEAAH